jgi:O-antigen/teichoic acid export membrane protein
MIISVLLNWMSIVLTAVSTFILYPYCVRVLGKDQYGAWLLVVSIVGFFSLLQLGAPLANVRFISKYLSTNDNDMVNKIASTNFIIFFVVGVLSLVIGLAIAYYLNLFFDIPVVILHATKISLVLLSLNTALSFFFEVYEGMFHATQEFVYFNLIKCIIIVTRVASTFYFLNSDNGLVVLPALLVFHTVIQSIMFYLYINNKYSFFKIRLSYFRYESLKMIFRYSVYVVVLQLASRINFYSDSIVIGSVIGIEHVVSYGVAGSIINYLMQFSAGISAVVLPRASKVESSKGIEHLGDYFIRISKLTAFFVYPVCICFFIVGGNFIKLWMGEEIAVVSDGILQILLYSNIIFLVQWSVSYPMLMGTSNLKFPVIALLFTSIINVLLSILLGKKLGIHGVAWGTTVANIVNTIIMICFSCRVFHVKLCEYLRMTVVTPLFSCIFFVVPIFLLKQYLVDLSYITFIIQVILSFILYLVVLYVFFLDCQTKIAIKKVITILP